MIDIIKKDFLPSIVVFLVAVPLCIGIALACGVSPVAGLLSGIIGGLVVGTFSGCPLMLSGPAAGLIAIVWDIINSHGLGGLAVCIALAGVFQVALGVAKLGVMFRAVSPAVIQGMLAGIGALIFFSQFHVMLDALPVSSGIQNLLKLPGSIITALKQTGSSHQMAGIVGVITITIIAGWKLVPNNLQKFPAVLIGVVIASTVAQIFSFDISYVKTPESLLILPDIYSSEYWQKADLTGLLIASLGLAFIATAEALLTATATDKLHDGKKTNYNKEVLAQGIGNIFCGFLGALPVTGVIVRSAANTQSGAETRASAVIHAIWILTFILIFPSVLQLIPVSTLAAALVYTGWKLMNPKVARELAAHSKVELVIFLITVLCIFCFGLLNGVIAGFVLAILNVVYSLNHCIIDIHKEDEALVIDIHGSATFLTLPKIAAALEGIEKKQEVHVLVHDLSYIDHAVLELLMTWETEYQKEGGSVVMEWDHVHHRTAKPLTRKQEVDNDKMAIKLQ